jgi:hypothetical protein
MPYSVGAKGSYGCSGYPAIKTATGEVMGCHETKADAVAQIQAIAISEAKAKKLWAGSAFGKSVPEEIGGSMPEADTEENASQCDAEGPDCGDPTCKMCAKKSMDAAPADGTPAGMKNPDQCGPGWECGKEDCMKCAQKAFPTPPSPVTVPSDNVEISTKKSNEPSWADSIFDLNPFVK